MYTSTSLRLKKLECPVLLRAKASGKAPTELFSPSPESASYSLTLVENANPIQNARHFGGGSLSVRSHQKKTKKTGIKPVFLFW